MPPFFDNFYTMGGVERPRSNRHYASSRLERASECAKAFRFGSAYTARKDLVRSLSHAPSLIAFLVRLPAISVPLSDDPAGAFIAEHLSLTRLGIPRFRLAQGILYLPPDFSSYLRGRRRQAVRTNVRRARQRGLETEQAIVPAWAPPDRGSRVSVSAEHWSASGPGGEMLADAWLVVDEEAALLYALAGRSSCARWLLHTAMVERLCASGCRVLITNSFDVPLMPEGQQHFQHLLGYSIARLLPPRPQHERQRIIPRRVGLGGSKLGEVDRESLSRGGSAENGSSAPFEVTSDLCAGRPEAGGAPPARHNHGRFRSATNSGA